MLSERELQLRLLLKYDPEFTAHFANPINLLLCEGGRTSSRIAARDAFEYTEDNECLFGYLVIPPPMLAELLRFKAGTPSPHAAGFASPTAIKTELPLMILTRTRDVFERRLKRFRKVINGEPSSDDSSSLSYLSSVVSHSTVLFLNQDLSHLDLSQTSSSASSSFFGSDAFNNYESLVSSCEKSQASGDWAPTKSKTG